MKVIALALLLCAGGDEIDAARGALFEAIAGANDTKGAAAADTVAALDSKEAADALLRAYSLCLSASDELNRQKEKLVKTMEEAGKDPKTGAWRDYTRFIKARDELTEANARLGRIEWIRLAVLRGFGKMRADAAVRELCGRLKTATDGGVRAIVAAALARIEHAEAVPALRGALKGEREAAVRGALLDALAERKPRDRETVAAICEQLGGEYWQVTCAAAGALRAIKSLDAVDPLIGALKGAEGRVQAELNAALAAITGVDKHGSHDAWKAWWAAHGEEVRAGTYRPEPSERARAPGGTTFYGVPVTSRRLAFVIDRSGSMAAKAKWKPDDAVPTGPGADLPKLAGDRKIDVARYELKRCLTLLPDGTDFVVVFYNREVETVSDRPLALNRETRRRTFEFIDTIQPDGATNISDALERALSFAVIGEKLAKAGIDTIYLLSDGIPTAGIVETPQLRARIAEVNRVRNVAIHGIAIEPTAESERFMKALAKEHGGTYARR